MCIIFNIVIVLAYACEMVFICDRLDYAKSKKDKRLYVGRLIISTVVSFVALLILYNTYGINDDTLRYYLSGRW